MKKPLYTTSEYIDHLTLRPDGNLYLCKGKEFSLFENAGAAEYDAKWLVDYWAKQGKKIKKPVVYRIKLERVANSAGDQSNE